MHPAIVWSLTVCALVHQVFAGVFITNPVVGSTAQGGQSLTISWRDDGAAPSLAEIGPCEFGIFAGNPQQQTELQPISPSVDVSRQGSLSFNINPAIGPNSGAYFIRITSLGLKDPKNPQFNYESFSAKFTLSNMSGQFSPLVQAQISGIISSTAAPSSPPRTSAPSATPAPNPTTGVKSSTASASAAKTTPTSGALMAHSKTGIMSAVGLAAAFGLLL